MKKITITYLSLLLILTSLFSTPVSVLANTDTEPEDENIEVETTEEAEAEDSNTEEAEPPGDEEAGTEPEEAATDEEVTEETSEETAEDAAASEQNSEEKTEEDAAEEEEVDEERYGFSLAIEEALNADGNHFTEEAGLDAEGTFTLRLTSILDADQNYQAEDVETVTLPESVSVAETGQGTVNSNGENIAEYTIHNNGQVEFTFTEAVETTGAVNEPVDVEVYMNESSVDEEFAYITPIEAEEQIVLPLAVEEDEATEEESQEATEDEVVEEESQEATEDEAAEEESEEATEDEATEEDSQEATEEEVTEENEERQGFSLAIEEALNDDGEVFTEEEGLDPEEALTLRVQSNLEEDQNYQAEDVEVVELPSSVEVAEATQGTLESEGTEIATYNVNEDGVTEFTFVEAVESVEAANASVDVEVFINEDSRDEEAELAYIDPIDGEEQLVVPLAVEEESAEIAPLAELTQNIFEFRSLTHNGVDIEDGATIDLSDGTQVELIFDWNTEGLNVQSGNTSTIQLPDAFEQITTPATPLITSDITVGTYQIQNGELQIIFNDNIEDGDVSNGEIGLNLDFNLQKFEENIEQVINFNDTTSKELNVIASPNNLASGITKEGHPDQAHNASEITWAIDVMNNSSEAVTTATLTDILPEGLGAPENFVITELSVGLNGDKTAGDTVDISPNINESSFDFAFDNINPYQGYRVEYTTPITDRDQTEFTNDATFHDGESELPAEATVSGLTASNPIEKSGSYNEETGQIDWKIVANENGAAIENTIIDDILPTGLSVDEEKFAVEKFVDGVSDGNVTIESNNFPLNLGQTAANEHYVINFSTDIDYEEVNDGNYQTGNDFENVATLNSGDEEIGRDEDVVEFDRQPLLEKGVTSGEVDYENKKINWTVDLNRAQHELNGVIVTDTLPEGLTLTEDDITITNSDDEDIKSNVNVNIAQGVTDSDGGDITFDFGDIGTQHITIKYETEITDFSENSFSNSVGLNGVGIGEEEHTTTIPANPPANSFEKNHGDINYNEKTMDWSLKVNPIREGIESLVIEDTFPYKGMILLPDTVEVSHSADDELTLDEDYTLEPRTEDGETGYHKGFIINLSGDYATLDGGTLDVEYQTSYDPQFEVEGNTLDPHPDEEGQTLVYLNNAHFTGTTTSGHDVDANREASTTVREDSWNSGKKEGDLVHEDSEGNIVNGWQGGTERKVAWELYTNYQQQNLGDDVVITDTLQYEGSIDEDSIRVSTYDVAPGGKTEIAGPVLDPGAYSVNVDGDTFTLTFNEEVSERYVVEFLTTVPNTSEEIYTNEATVSVDGTDYPYSGTVNYENYNNFLDKSSVGQEGSDVYIGDEVNWEVQVNDSLSIIDNAEITDIMSAGLEYVQGTLEISTLDGNTLSEGEDYVLSNTKTEDDRTRLNIELNESLNQILILNYTTVVTAEDEATVNNEVTLSGDNIENRTVTTEELTAEQFSWASGEFNENRGALQITKSDYDTEEAIADNPATFELYYDLNGERVQFGEQLQTDDNGEIQIGNLPLRTYYLVEVEAPTGYIIDETEQVIEITEPYGTDQITYDVEFTNKKTTKDISVTKEWEDGNNQDGTRPESVDVQLLADSEAIGEIVTISEDNEWTNTWTDLDEYQSNGELIEYTVEEVNVPEGYESTSEIDDNGNITITNTHTPETVEFSVSKEWDDDNDRDGVRPSNVTVNLLNGNEVVTEAVLNEDNEWQHTFTDLPKFSSGQEIQYSVTEDNVANYSTSIETTNTDTGLNSVVTNTYTPEETSATVTKLWDDGENQDDNRSGTVTVQLLADGDSHGDPVTLSEAENWTYTWSGLNLNTDGSAIEYTVQELEAPEGYEVSVNNDNQGNFVITNSYTPETIDIPVSKEWDDNKNQDDIRPDEVTVNLLADGEIINSAVLNSDKGWQHTFREQPVNENGNEITYTVTENTVEGYSASTDADPESENGFVITNTHTPDKTSVTATKAWEDAGNQDGNRPESIELQLTADGEPLRESVVITGEDGWNYTWSDLDVNNAGEPIEYSVEEPNVPEGYSASVNDEDHGNIIITNSYTTETLDIPVTKEWDDAENQDGERPSQIKLNLLNDRGETVREVFVSEQEGNTWDYTFTNIPKYENGEEINYRVTEDFVSDYSTTAVEDPSVENGYTLTNSYTPEKTSVTVTKGWDDENNQDGKRPSSIEVQLTADGEETGETQILSEGNNWSYTWSELELNTDGEAIDYSVEEVNVPEGYTSITNDANHGNIVITNSYTPELTEIPVVKVWDDLGDQDGERPSQIELNLLNDRGEIVKNAVVSEQEGEQWNYTFTDIPKYENGSEINYTVTENFVSDYSTNVAQNENGHPIVINSYTPEQTSVTVTKFWDDADNQDGLRPESIEVQLIKNGEPEGDPKELTSEGNWTDTWNELPLNEDGEAIEYSVEELNVPEGYTSSVNDTDQGNIVITNSHTPSLTEIPVQKAWEDEDDQDRVRPGHIIANLINHEGNIEERAILNDDNNWEHTFTGLTEYDNGELINYTITENAVNDYSTSIEENEDGVQVITNNYTPEETSVTVTKGWDDGNNQDGNRPESIEVQLYANGEPEGEAIELTSEDNWTYTWQTLALNEEGEEIEYSVEELNVPEEYEAVYNNENRGNIIISNSYSPQLTEISGTKTWNDGDNQDGKRPDSITVNLLANGDEVDSRTVIETDDWEYDFTELPVFEAGEEIDYTIEEVSVEEYETEIDGFDIINSYTPETTEVSGTKIWNDADNQDGKRPEAVIVNLSADGELVDSSEVTADDNWEYSFTNLPVFKAGEEIDYTIAEEPVEGYETTIEDYDITNSYSPEVTEVSGTKTWDDGDNQDDIRPNSIAVNLLADGEVIDSSNASAATDWTYSFTDLPVYDAGSQIEYTVEEAEVPEEYESTVDGFDITNAYTPETTEVSVSKEWDDEENQDDIRPNNVTVNLLNDSEVVTEAVLNEDNEWQHTFTDLPKFSNGQEIQYSVTEDAVANYSTSIETTESGEGLNSVVTNTYTPEETTATVTKVWDDGNNQDGNRPDNVTVQLLADGDSHGDPVELTANDNWTHTWSGLDVNAEGTSIDYTIEEIDAPEGYEVSVNNENHGNLVITNSYSPETIDIPVTKVWDDSENQDNIRPDSVTANLLNDSGQIVEQVVLSENNEWQYTFADLPVYESGEEINYTVTENTVENYSTSIEENEENQQVITNHYTPEETSITVTKGWDDENNKNGYRSESIEVQLTASGEAIEDTITLSDDNNWTGTWKGLDLNESGEAINYSVEELDVPEGYTSSINDEDHGNIVVTNSQNPKVSVGDYVWIDENRDGLQDDTDTPLEGVELTITDSEGNPVTDIYGESVEPTTTDENGYYTFENLPIDNEYTVTINQETFEESFPELIPTIEVEDDRENDSSTWTTTSIFLDEDGQRDPTLDFGFVVPSVSVGDYVWIDENRDGLQDETDTPLEGVELTITDSEGNPVTDVNGNEVGPTTTDENGYYTFENLPIDNEYIVTINQEKFEESFPGLSPTIEVEDNRENDSSTWTATSVLLDEDGQRDPTLDFGFVTPVTPETTEVSVEKVWEHGDNESELPTSVEIKLLDEEGTEVETATLDDSNEWQYTFTGLAEGNYAVTENAIENYKSSIASDDENHFTVMNTFVPEDPEDPKEPTEPGKPEDPEEPTDEGTPETEEGEDTPSDPTDEGTPGTEEDDGTPTDSTEEGTPGAEEGEGTPTDSTDEGTPGSEEDEGTGTGLPNTGVALGSTIAIIATVLLAIGAALLFFARRRSN